MSVQLHCEGEILDECEPGSRISTAQIIFEWFYFIINDLSPALAVWLLPVFFRLDCL